MDIGCVVTQGPRCHLAVNNLGSQVSVVGRHLAPAMAAVLGGNPDKTDKGVAKSFNAFDFHGLMILGNLMNSQVHFEKLVIP
jgi:hypothetical protein